MAGEQKRSFVLYMDYAEHLDQLTDADCGILFRAIFDHMDPDKPEPTLPKGTAVAMAYSFIKGQLDRDRQAYEDKCERNRQTAIEAAKKRAEARADADTSERKRTRANATERKQTPTNASEWQHNDNDNDTDNDTDTDMDIKTNTSPAPPDDAAGVSKKDLQEERFAEFWALYPKKVGKGAARNSWKRIKPTAELFERIMAAVAAQKLSPRWTKNNGQYIPNPATWLNQQRWDDEVEAAVAGERQQTQAAGGERFDAGSYLNAKLAGFRGEGST